MTRMEPIGVPGPVPRAVTRSRLLLVILAASLWCCAGAPGEPDLDAEARTLRSLSTVAGTRVVGPADRRTTPASLIYTWELEGDGEWHAYRESLRTSFARRPEFRPTATDGGSVVYSRTLPGDLHTVRAEAISAGPPLRVRITFQSSAD